MQDPSHSDCIIPVRFINIYFNLQGKYVQVPEYCSFNRPTATNVYVVADLKLLSLYNRMLI